MNSHSPKPYDWEMNTHPPVSHSPVSTNNLPPPPIPYEEWKTAVFDPKFGDFKTLIVVSKRRRILTKLRVVRLSEDEDFVEKVGRVYQDLKINYSENESYNQRIGNGGRTPSNIDVLLKHIRLSKGPVNLTTISDNQIQGGVSKKNVIKIAEIVDDGKKDLENLV